MPDADGERGGEKMIRRKCPKCDANWYSANTEPWVCGKCGTVLDKQHELPLEEERENPL